MHGPESELPTLSQAFEENRWIPDPGIEGLGEWHDPFQQVLCLKAYLGSPRTQSPSWNAVLAEFSFEPLATKFPTAHR